MPERAVAPSSPPPAFYAERLDKHDRADFAQEFLRRNPAYRGDWAAWSAASAGTEKGWEGGAKAGRWGLVRFFDPGRPVRAEPAIWLPGCAAQLVSLVAAPGGFAGAAALPPAPRMVDFVLGGERWIIVDGAGVRHRLRVIGDEDGPLAILLPPRGDALRAAACDAARRLFAGLGGGGAAAALRPSALQRRRLTLLLRVHDAWVAGASIREIGLAVVYPWLTAAEASGWKASSERRRVQRLVAEARDLVAFDYRALLRA